jgi:hypothetical protein
MLYRGYRITLAEFQGDQPFFLILRRHSSTIVATATTVRSSIGIIDEIERQLTLPTTQEATHG